MAVPLPGVMPLRGPSALNDSIVYNVPAAMVDAHRGRNLIVRSRDPAELVHRLAAHGPEGVAYLQVLGTGGDVEELLRCEDPVPVDLVLEDPVVDLPRLYRYSPLLADRPVRVSVPRDDRVRQGGEAGPLLEFRGETGAFPAGAGTDGRPCSWSRTINLHQSTVAQPVEYFHTVFAAFCRCEPVSLWAVQEEDPCLNRFVTDQGAETISRRFARADLKPDPVSFLDAFIEGLLSEQHECHACRFFEICLGHFKLAP